MRRSTLLILGAVSLGAVAYGINQAYYRGLDEGYRDAIGNIFNQDTYSQQSPPTRPDYYWDGDLLPPSFPSLPDSLVKKWEEDLERRLRQEEMPKVHV